MAIFNCYISSPAGIFVTEMWWRCIWSSLFGCWFHFETFHHLPRIEKWCWRIETCWNSPIHAGAPQKDKAHDSHDHENRRETQKGAEKVQFRRILELDVANCFIFVRHPVAIAFFRSCNRSPESPVISQSRQVRADGWDLPQTCRLWGRRNLVKKGRSSINGFHIISTLFWHISLVQGMCFLFITSANWC